MDNFNIFQTPSFPIFGSKTPPNKAGGARPQIRKLKITKPIFLPS
ncbi:hypothetical protein B4064_2172 [Caldibacillus thermoamylovorans]|jgi:hypothetical protein|nr:hypothetical protein B4064_2172 [Caldibacillus thermoamylovorans]